jgi:hypothetical protein
MNKQNKQFKWISINLMLDKIRHVEKRYGDYSIAVLLNGYRVVIDNKNSRVLVMNGTYLIDKNFEKWFKRGFIVINHAEKNKDYIFNAKDGSLVFAGYIVENEAFLRGTSDYFIVQNTQIKSAIFDKEGKQVSGWYNWIDPNSLVSGKSDYYKVVNNLKQAIFHKDGRLISGWFDKINVDDLANGLPDYYKVENDGKQALFQRDGKQVSDWYDEIYSIDLTEGSSDYYLAQRNGKHAIFDKNGNQITDWLDWIGLDGLVFGQSDYYVAANRKKMYIGKLGSSKLFGPFKDIPWDNLGFIRDSSSSNIVVYTLDGKELNISKQEVEDYFEGKKMEIER